MSTLILATSTMLVIAHVLFFVATVIAVSQKSWVIALVAAGLAVAFWPW